MKSPVIYKKAEVKHNIWNTVKDVTNFVTICYTFKTPFDIRKWKTIFFCFAKSIEIWECWAVTSLSQIYKYLNQRNDHEVTKSVFYFITDTKYIHEKLKKHNIFSVIPDFNIKWSLAVNLFVLVEYWQSDLNLKRLITLFLC